MVQQTGMGRARRLLAQAQPDLVEVGGLVRAARIRGDFKAFCAAVSLGTRKAYELIAIADAVNAGRLQEAVVQEIGWSKSGLIAERATTKSETRRATAFARKNTLAALSAYFKENGTGAKLVTKCFHLTENQAQQLETALDQAGARRRQGRMDNRAEALMSVLREFRQPKETRPAGRKRRG